MSKKIRNIFLKRGKVSLKMRPIFLKAIGYYIRGIRDRYWESIMSLLLKYIAYKNYRVVVKTDLWDEVILRDPIRKEILNELKPKRLLYIDFVKEFSMMFKKIYKSNKEIPIVGDIRDWPFKENSIDVIVDVSTSDHLRLKDFKKVIREYKRALKPEGFLLLYHLNSEYFFIKKFLAREAKFPTYPRASRTIEKILMGNGFEIVKKFYLFSFLTDSALEMCELWRRILLILSLFMGEYSFYLFHLVFGGRRLSAMIGYVIRKASPLFESYRLPKRR